MKFIDLTGRRFGRLLVVNRASNIGSKSMWHCVCDCGARKFVRGDHLCAGLIRSCRCLNNEGNNNRRRSMRGTTEYRAWQNIRQRCYDPNHVSYVYYGAIGVIVCRRWLRSFENFYADMGEKPSSQHSIDRINPNGNYTPRNCRWADAITQARNKRGKK